MISFQSAASQNQALGFARCTSWLGEDRPGPCSQLGKATVMFAKCRGKTYIHNQRVTCK